MRVYVAGPYSSDNVLGVLENIRDGINACTRLFEAGLSPYCPWLDYHYVLASQKPLSVNGFYKLSLDWLMASNAMLVIGAWKKSKGTKLEISKANEYNIPVFYDIESLLRYADTWGGING